ncbi:MAG: hypothetical protein P9X22_04075 [Candidatus Zapsychrus exili]|nr:hypothetical protein [Candidatus Zapsychrus exili]
MPRPKPALKNMKVEEGMLISFLSRNLSEKYPTRNEIMYGIRLDIKVIGFFCRLLGSRAYC